MFSHSLFISYTVMVFLGLQGVTLVIMILRHNNGGNVKLLSATRNFVIVSLVLGLFYFFTYYRELVLGEFAANIFLRGLDAIVFYAMGYAWVKLIDAIIDSKDSQMIPWRKWTNKVFFVLMGISAATYIFFLDEYYSTHKLWEELLVIFLEVVLAITVIIFTFAYLIIGFKGLKSRFTKKYIIIISLLVNFNNLWNNIVVIAVFIKAVELSVWCTTLYGITSIILLVINLLTLYYIYIKDFSPIYFKKNSQKTKSDCIEEAISYIAMEGHLTEREREVMALAYKGLTNPDIANELYISRHTVKRHLHNIFEKLHIATRMELVHMINEESEAT